jgi:HK97 gp10 family phage protein
MARRGVEFELIGLSDLTRSLEGLSTSITNKLADALDDSAHAIQYRARVNVPRDKGDLARAIQIAGKGLSLKVGLDDAAVASRGGKNTAHLHPWVYGLFVEFGLKAKQMAARPFMGPAVDQEQHAHDDRVERALSDAMAST